MSDYSHETFVVQNPDGSVSLDPQYRMSREDLKARCAELCMALDEWRNAAMLAATDGGNSLENVREPYRTMISNQIIARGD